MSKILTCKVNESYKKQTVKYFFNFRVHDFEYGGFP